MRNKKLRQILCYLLVFTLTFSNATLSAFAATEGQSLENSTQSGEETPDTPDTPDADTSADLASPSQLPRESKSDTTDGSKSTTPATVASPSQLPHEAAWDGEGSEDNPYLLKNADDLVTLQKKVNAGESYAGKYFHMKADITLPDDWTPIGCTIDGTTSVSGKSNLRAFSGIIDGAKDDDASECYTLTVPEEGLPLLGYVYKARVQNLDIYGTKIAGAGLVNNYTGCNSSSYDAATGSYSSGSEFDCSAIEIDNVTLLSGTSTLKSGLVASCGGSEWEGVVYSHASANFIVTITNCTIEEGVIIGYDKDQSHIGSFAGRVNCTIENSTSSADVYGVDYVGGILGGSDNAMGTCEVENCEFDGTVEATGSYVGGIVGGGYDNDSAPNGTVPTINACVVTGTVNGDKCVGGILGGDGYVVQTWDNVANYINANDFTGKISGNEYVGAIIGYRNSLNRYDNISGNTYSPDCGAGKGIAFVKYLDTDYEDPAAMADTIVINTADGTDECPEIASWFTWKTEHNRTDDPLGKDASKLCKRTGNSGSWEGSGTEEDPYLIQTVYDLFELEELVADGNSFANTYFWMTADITLPWNWEPIGCFDGEGEYASGMSDLHPFSGTIDAAKDRDNPSNGCYTLTVSKGSLPLLGYVYKARVQNLNIYGEKIYGAGLVNNLTGCNQSLYDESGNWIGSSTDFNCSAIEIDNVTLLSGTSTLKSGLVASCGGNAYAHASANFIVTITNCTIEEGVTIGYEKDQSHIGSFAGRVTCKIEDSTSAATVYGESYVGGILGSPDNSMGMCEITGCEFSGKVIATGSYAGGIVGGGYEDETTTNAAIPTINACTVSGTVKGDTCVGGIFGGDGYVVQTLENVANAINANEFTGKVSGSKYIGGIIGYLNSLNRYNNISGNKYSATCGASKGIGLVKYLDTNYAKPYTVTGTTVINTEDGTDECPTIELTSYGWTWTYDWYTGLNRTDNPLGTDASKLCKKVSSGSSSGGSSSGGSSGGGGGSSSSSKSTSSSMTSGTQLKSAASTAPAAAAGTWQKDAKGWKYNFTTGGHAAGTQVKDALGNTIERLTWAKIGGIDFAFGADGYLKTGWVCDGTNGQWYYCDENKGKVGGWYQSAASKDWYYLDPNTGIMATGWQLISGKWYYFAKVQTPATGTSKAHELGSMYAGTTTPDNATVDASGAWVY